MVKNRQQFYYKIAEPTSLPVNALECQICFDLVESAVNCQQCGQFFCDIHVNELQSCPFCRVTPVNVQVDRTLRRLVDQLPVICLICKEHVKKGDFAVHTNHCQSLHCGANGCEFSSGHKETALNHVLQAHGDIIWQNYSRLTAAGPPHMML